MHHNQVKLKKKNFSQLQNEEEPVENLPVVNDFPPPYSSISGENSGKHLEVWYQNNFLDDWRCNKMCEQSKFTEK